jgi:hypothetical protein
MHKHRWEDNISKFYRQIGCIGGLLVAMKLAVNNRTL